MGDPHDISPRGSWHLSGTNMRAGSGHRKMTWRGRPQAVPHGIPTRAGWQSTRAPRRRCAACARRVGRPIRGWRKCPLPSSRGQSGGL